MQWHPINGPFQLHFRKLNPMSKSGTHPSLCYTSQRRIPQIGRHYPDRSRVNSMKWKQALNESTCNLPLLEKQPVYPMTSKIVIKMLLLTHQWTDFRALPSEAPLCTHFFSRIAPNHGVYIRPNQEADMSQLKFTEPALKWLTADWVIFWFHNRPLIKRSFTRDINKWVEHNDFPVPCLI